MAGVHCRDPFQDFSKMMACHNLLGCVRPKKKNKSPFSGHRSASKSVRWQVFFFFFVIFFFANQRNMWYMYMRLLEPSKMFHTESIVAKRLHISGKRSYPYVKNIVYNTAWQKSTQSGNFGCNWTSFHSPQKRKKLKLKMPTPTRAETRNRYNQQLYKQQGSIQFKIFISHV